MFPQLYAFTNMRNVENARKKTIIHARTRTQILVIFFDKLHGQTVKVIGDGLSPQDYIIHCFCSGKSHEPRQATMPHTHKQHTLF
jgi:hypothetical protein